MDSKYETEKMLILTLVNVNVNLFNENVQTLLFRP